MSILYPFMKPGPGMCMSRRSACQPERGIVLVLALILLVVISLLSVVTLRNVSSSESTAANVRTTELATQSAEIALRHCEASALGQMTVQAGGSSSYPTTFTAANMLAAQDPPRWQTLSLWDSSDSAVFVLPLTLLNQVNMAITTYKRPPECMVEQLPSVSGADPASFVVITVRGFGPEVPALVGPVRLRPVGSEVWLQSVIKTKLEPNSN